MCNLFFFSYFFFFQIFITITCLDFLFIHLFINIITVLTTNLLFSAYRSSVFFPTTEYSEKYQEILDREDYFPDAYEENGNDL